MNLLQLLSDNLPDGYLVLGNPTFYQGDRPYECDGIVVDPNSTIFIIEAKDWHGNIVCRGRDWEVVFPNGMINVRPNPISGVTYKAKVLHGTLDEECPALRRAFTTALVVLTAKPRFDIKLQDKHQEQFVCYADEAADCIIERAKNRPNKLFTPIVQDELVRYLGVEPSRGVASSASASHAPQDTVTQHSAPATQSTSAPQSASAPHGASSQNKPSGAPGKSAQQSAPAQHGTHYTFSHIPKFSKNDLTAENQVSEAGKAVDAVLSNFRALQQHLSGCSWFFDYVGGKRVVQVA